MAANDTIKIAKLETQMTNVEQKIDKLDAKFDKVITKIDHLANLQTEVLTLKEELAELRVEYKEELAKILEANRAEILELKKRQFRAGWLYPTLSAVAGALLTVLVLSYLDKL